MKKLLFLLLFIPSIGIAQLSMRNFVGESQSLTLHLPSHTDKSIDAWEILGYGILPLISGACDGAAESLIWHYDRFQLKYPNADPYKWNPHLSWLRKWRNGDPAQGERFFGSSSIFAWLVDPYHGFRTGHRWSLVGAVSCQAIFIAKHNPNFGRVARNMLIGLIAYQIGAQTMYLIVMQ